MMDGTYAGPDDTPIQLTAETLYRTGSEVMDSINDLLEQGGSLTDLEIEVSGVCDQLLFRDTWRVRITKEGRPGLSHYSSYDDDAIWEVYGKVRAIFDNRQMVLKNLVYDLPSPSNWVAVVFSVLGVVLFDFHGTVFKILGGIIFALPVLFAALVYMLYTIPNHVSLVRSHVRSRDRAETRRKYTVNAVIFVLGALFKTVLDFLTKKYLK